MHYEIFWEEQSRMNVVEEVEKENVLAPQSSYAKCVKSNHVAKETQREIGRVSGHQHSLLPIAVHVDVLKQKVKLPQHESPSTDVTT